MAEPNHAAVFAAVEGMLDEVVLRRLLAESGTMPAAIYGKQGKQRLFERIGQYNDAARYGAWVVLVDLDGDEECAPLLCRNWLPRPARGMCFRVAVHEVESWLLADRGAFSRFMGVPVARLPLMPERELDPKRTVVDLARGSRYRTISEDMVPRPGSGRKVGPAYTSRLAEFVSGRWSPAEASRRSDSLARCIRRLAGVAAARRHTKAGDSTD